MSSCCICYTTDQHYLLPTLVSAIQARHYARSDDADVAIFGFQTTPKAEHIFRSVCEAEGIIYRSVGSEIIEQASAMMSRLFLTRFTPSSYSRYLYIDSDVHITGPLSGLLKHDVPSARFMAANDPLTFSLPDLSGQSCELRSYFSSIGIKAEMAGAYFNTGVLLINRDGWEQIGLNAWRLFCERGKSFRFPDQDVLNLVAGGQRIPMSLAWNFPIFMRNCRVEHEIKPHLYHFMSKPKPWQGAYPPWTANASRPYSEIVSRYPCLAPYATVMPLRSHLRYHAQQRIKKLVEVIKWGFSERRNRILAYEQACRLIYNDADLATMGGYV